MQVWPRKQNKAKNTRTAVLVFFDLYGVRNDALFDDDVGKTRRLARQYDGIALARAVVEIKARQKLHFFYTISVRRKDFGVATVDRRRGLPHGYCPSPYRARGCRRDLILCIP